MSNQSGIGISEALSNAFPDFIESDDIAAVLNIDHKKEHVDLSARVSGTLADLQSHLQNDALEASYIALRLDEGFAFVQFMPDEAPLSSKMKYASSMATVHKQLGGSATFHTNIFWTTIDEVSLQGVEAHVEHENAPPPMTEEEANLASALRTMGTKGSSVAGQSTLAIHAHVSADAKSSITTLADGDALVFKVLSDESETIELAAALPVAELATHFSALAEPRYVVGKLDGKTFFVVISPSSATIKQRMLFASTRISFLEYLRTLVDVDAQIETFEPAADLTVDALRAELGEDPAPKHDSNSAAGSAASKPRFSRPRPPKRAR